MRYESIEIPGTAQIRKVSAQRSSVELLELCAKLASEGYEKKLWSVLSRVYEEKRGFGGGDFPADEKEYVREALDGILKADVPSELKLQTFTSFQISREYIPSAEEIRTLIKNCDSKRLNIAVYFFVAYDCAGDYYEELLKNKAFFSLFIKLANEDAIITVYEQIIQRENKEYITGSIRQLQRTGRKFYYKDKQAIRKLTELVFASKQVFFSTKLLYCIAFSVPKECLPTGKEMWDILKISINYEESITIAFVKRYQLDFDCSDLAMCRYYLGNKKATKEKVLVGKFAAHLVNVEDEFQKKKLLRGAFKRGGMFRMYAGCMQDGEVNEEKLHKFHYSEEDIAWCRTLPGLK